MKATMMSLPLSTQMILRHGQRLHGASSVASFDDGRFRRASFEQVATRAESLARALEALGVRTGDRVATYCWNHQAHLDAYLAVPAMGAVLHTLNVRLFPEQVGQIMAHADDRVLIVDAVLWPQIEAAARGVAGLRHIVIVGHVPQVSGLRAEIHGYESLLAAHRGAYPWPELDEWSAAVVCYTTGTTGEPKGVVYSHRTIFLHTLATLGADTFAISQSDRVLLLPSMFHANAWGLPFSCWFAGADLLLPGPNLKPGQIRAMIELGRPTFTAMVPTLINDLLQADLSCPPRHVELSRDRVGRLGSLAGVDRQGAGALGRAGAAGLGDDGDEPDMLSLDSAARRAPRGRGRLAREKWSAGAGHGGPAGRRSGQPDSGGRRNGRGAATPRSVGHGELPSRSFAGIVYRGRVVAHRRRGDDRCPRLRADHRSREGRDQVRRRVGFVGRPREPPRRASRGNRSGGDRNPRPALGGAAARAGRHGDGRALAGRPSRVPPDRVARFWIPEYWAYVAELPKTSVGKIDKKELRRLYAEGRIQLR
jgi:fatty-acyl-CoA synthase